MPGNSSNQPLMHMICFSVCTTSTKSAWAAITASMSLYAPGISSSTPRILAAFDAFGLLAKIFEA